MRAPDGGDAAVDDVLDGTVDNAVTGPRPGRFRRFQARMRRTRAGAIVLRVVVTLIGTLVILAGIVMLVGPGQGVLAIILGLAILATEYAWAHRWMTALKRRVDDARQRAKEMDPKVRRRRILIGVLILIALLAACTAYVMNFGWPALVLHQWSKTQRWFGFLPDLPQP